MEKTDRIWILMAKKIAGEASGEELDELNQLLNNTQDISYPFAVIQALKDCHEENALPPADEELLMERGLNSIKKKIAEDRDGYGEGSEEGDKKRLFLKRLIAIAASVIIVVGLAYAVLQKKAEQPLKNEITTRSGSKTTITLPDGTIVWLNSCSQLQYADGFINGKRVVTLNGEGLFEVKKDKDHPFIIHAGDIDIRVLGTRLNVKAYPEDDRIEAMLINGKVEVDLKTTSEQRIILKPDQKITILKNIVMHDPLPDTSVSQTPDKLDFAVTTLKKKKDAAFAETSWLDNTLEFSQVTFEQLSHDMERQYNVHIYFENDRCRNQTFSGVFKNQRIDEILHALQLTSDFHYRIDSLNNVHVW